jgi:hypothetical protein
LLTLHVDPQLSIALGDGKRSRSIDGAKEPQCVQGLVTFITRSLVKPAA